MVMMAVACLVACSSESYPGVEYEPVMSDDLKNTESSMNTNGKVPVNVLIGANSFSISQATRGTGPFTIPDGTDDYITEHYQQAFFHIFAFRDRRDEQGNDAVVPDYTKRSGDENDTHGDCLIDGISSIEGMAAKLDPDGDLKLHMKRANLRVDSILYYYTRHADKGYNFFVYHLDDFKPTIENTHRSTDKVSYDVEIDGARDYMVGCSPRLTPQVLNEYYPDAAAKLSDIERNYILNIGNYSRYAADHGIDPIVTIKHLLPRIRFVCYPADASANKVQIERITLSSRHTGNLVVASADTKELGFSSFNDDRIDIALGERNPDGEASSPFVPLVPKNNIVNWEPGMDPQDWMKNGGTVIGGDLLLAPDTEYKMHIVYTQELSGINPVTGERNSNEISAIYTITAPKIDESMNPQTGEYQFMGGLIYNVNIGVYGLRPLEMNVGLDGWEEGGNIDVQGDPLEDGSD